MSDISRSAYGEPDNDSALAEALNAATSSAEVLSIVQKFKAAATAPNGAPLFLKDIYDPTVLLENPDAAASATPTRFATTISNPRTGEKVIFESNESEADCLRKSNEWMRQQFAADATPADSRGRDAHARDSQGRFVQDTADETSRTEADVFAKAELELKFKRGEISAQDFIQQSGAIKSYLEEQGIPLDELRETVQQKQSARFEESWTQGTADFRARHQADWVGGAFNRDLLGRIILEQHWEDSDPLSALEAAYKFARENNMLQTETPESALGSANSAAEIDELLNAYRPNGGSSLFNR